MADEPRADAVDEEPAGTTTAERTKAEQLAFALSLPERALRSGSGMVGGVLRESAALLVPRSFQSSRTYSVMVRQMLDFLVHDVGGVQPKEGETQAAAQVDVARKAAGSFVDMASMATLHVSPLLVLAAVSDLAYGSQVYLHELADELKKQGVVDENTTIDHVNDLLGAVSKASAMTGSAFDTPPLSVEALKASIDETRAAIAEANPSQVLPQAEIQRLWEEMRDIARRENVGMLAVSGAASMHALDKMNTLGRGALSGAKVAGKLLDRHVLDHYSQAIGDIRERGLYNSLAETSEPYIAAVWKNFQPSKTTVTEDALSGKLAGDSWRAVRRWLGGKPDTAGEAPGAPQSDSPKSDPGLPPAGE